MAIRRNILAMTLWFVGYVAFFSVLFWPLLFWDFIVTHKDIRTFTYPLITLVSERLWTGDVFWNDLNGFGFPSFLTDGYALNPLLTFFLMFLSPFQASHWTVALSVLIGGWLSGLLLWQWGFSREASFLTGLTAATSLWPWLLNPSNAIVVLSLPALLLLLTRPGIPALIRYACGITIMSVFLLTAFPHFVIIELLVIGIVAGVYAVRDKDGWRSPVVMRLGVILLFSGCISLLRFLPLLAYGKLSTRMEASTVAELAPIGWNLPFHLFFPEPRTPSLGGSVEIMPFIGLLPLICTMVAVFMHRRQALTKLCFGVLLLSLFLAAFPRLLQHVPLYASFGSPSRWLLLGKFAVLPLIALGFDAMIGGIPKKRQRMIAVLCMLPLPLLFFFQYMNPGTTKNTVMAWNLALSANKTTLFVAVAIGLVLFPPLWKRLRRLQVPALAAIGAGTLLLSYRPLVQDWIAPRARLLFPDLTHASDQSHIQVLSPLTNIQYREQILVEGALQPSLRPLLMSVSSILLQPNQNIFLRISTADIYDPLYPKRASYLLGALGSDTLRIPTEISLAKNSLSTEEKLAVFQKRHYLLDTLAITHIFSNFELNDMNLQKVGSAPIVGEVYGETFRKEIHIPRIAYRNPSARPLMYFAPEIVFLEPDPDRVYRMLLAEAWPSYRTFVECPGCEGTFVPSQSGEIEVLEQSPTHVLLDTSSAGEQWLVVSQHYLPGWKVTVDGQEIHPALAQSLFFAIPVSPGDHVVELRFSLGLLLRDSIALLLSPAESVWM